MKAADRKEAVDAAMSLATDIAEGRVDSGDLDRQLRDELAAMFTNVVGPGDLCWELQVEVARAVLAVGGGVSADELSEWAAVARSREAPDGVTTPEEPVEAVSVELGRDHRVNEVGRVGG